MSTRFLEQISQTDSTAAHVVIQEQARFHLLPLPSYSPELNPVERGGTLPRACTANWVFADLPTMEAVVTEASSPLWMETAAGASRRWQRPAAFK